MYDLIDRDEYFSILDSIATETATIAANADWSGMEKGFTNYLVDRKETKLISYIKTSLEKNTKKNFTISIVNKDEKESFFGCRVFASQAMLDRIVEEIALKKDSNFSTIYNMWADIKDWVIEIDAHLFNRYELNLNPSELTAIILHEIGHVVYYDGTLERMYRAFQECKIQNNLSDKPSLKILYILYMIPLSISCLQKTWVTQDNGKKLEIMADDIVISQGYGEYLQSALEKIIRAYGNTVIKTYSNDSNEKEMKEYINWATINVSDINYRQKHLKDELYNRANRHSSHYLKILAKNIMQMLGIKTKEIYTGMVTESNVELLSLPKDKFHAAYEIIWDPKENMVIESTINQLSTITYNSAMEGSREKNPPSQYLIDSIGLEIDHMSDQRDRIFILDLIYSQMRLNDQYSEYLESHPIAKLKYGNDVKRQREQLEQYRCIVLDKRTCNTRPLFVQYTGNKG